MVGPFEPVGSFDMTLEPVAPFDLTGSFEPVGSFEPWLGSFEPVGSLDMIDPFEPFRLI